MWAGWWVKDLLSQEVDNEPVVAGELANEGPGRLMTAKRKCREVQTGGPSFSPFDKIGHVGCAEIDGSNTEHQRSCLYWS